MTTFRQFLIEAWHSTLTKKLRIHGKSVDHHADIFKNPSRKEMKEVTHEGWSKPLVHKDHKNVYVFHPEHAFHDDVGQHLGDHELNHHYAAMMDHKNKEVHFNHDDPDHPQRSTKDVDGHPYFKRMGYKYIDIWKKK